MSEKMAFRLAVIAAVVMLGIIPLMSVTAAPCSELPMSTLTAYELVRSAGDLQRIFGAAGDACGVTIAAQLDHANVVDAAAYVPAYTAFYALTLFALGQRDKTLGWAGVAISIVNAVADWAENAAMFALSPPQESLGWIPALIVATNIKWVGLAVATTLGGVMLMRRGGLGWLGLVPCAVPLVTSLWAVAMPDAAGKWLMPGMVVASVTLLAVAVWGSFAKQPVAAGAGQS
ncbi:MAG: hypothetical protein Q8R02_02070 [Hyphomonadaceae bacterium]|nr:hypothetical protein [Hyphomonadaceae bacterium]